MCWIEEVFPNLSADNYEITSAEDKGYNSFAWAIGINSYRAEPNISFEIHSWPSDVPPQETLEAFTAFYSWHGYEICDNADSEPGFDKVALYVDSDGRPTHAARQLATGKWASKIFDVEDIEHDSLECLEGEMLGYAVRFLKKPCD